MTELWIGIGALIVGALLGWLGASLRSGAAARAAHAKLLTARNETALEQARNAVLTDRAAAAEAATVRREQELRAEHERYVAQVRSDQEALKEQFKALAADVLKTNNEQFLEVASERLKRAQQSNEAELAKREEAVKKLVEPMAKALDEVKVQTTEAEKQRATTQAQLAEQVRNMLSASEKLDKRTGDFINTLRRSDVRGNWGEVQLRRVVELAGMLPHVDFTEQEVVRDSEGKVLRPDLTVRLAGGRSIVVDSKVALNALLEAFEADDERVRAERLNAHAKHVRRHVDDLSSKKYWEQFSSAPEFVVMFVPSEAFYQAALEQDPNLQEYAYTKSVFIATPTTLMAMLRTVAHAWREDTLARNAQQVLSTGKELYERLRTMGGHLERVGKAIDNAGKAYNETVASLESRVLVTARKFGAMQELEAPIDPMKPTEVMPRQIAAPEYLEEA